MFGCLIILYLPLLHIIMSNRSNRKAIHQFHVCLDHETMTNYLVLVEFENNIPIASYIVMIPHSFNYYDQDYQYYTINNN
jgi:hypothetical protein